MWKLDDVGAMLGWISFCHVSLRGLFGVRLSFQRSKVGVEKLGTVTCFANSIGNRSFLVGVALFLDF